MKKAAGGNWGHPRKFTKRHTNIDIPDDDAVPKMLKKKKKKEKKPYKFWTCPFCREEIPERKENNSRAGTCLVRWEREDHCKCGAIEVPHCPACFRTTWHKDGVFKHLWMGCGFEGKKKNA